MLVLSRQVGQGVRGRITVEGLKKLLAKAEASESKDVTFSVTLLRRGLGFEFPREIRLVRGELRDADAA